MIHHRPVSALAAIVALSAAPSAFAQTRTCNTASNGDAGASFTIIPPGGSAATADQITGQRRRAQS